MLSEKASVAVIIPTYNRGRAVISVLERVLACDPLPAEIWVHIDCSDGILQRELTQHFPGVHVLTSAIRLGPGGGRHRCLLGCGVPYAVSLDDDSWPADSDFFGCIESLFAEYPKAAIFGASISDRWETEKPRQKRVSRVAAFIGCGHVIRVEAYRQVRGYLARQAAYGMEESDLGLQLFSSGWKLYEAAELRVYHDTDRRHHGSAEITSAIITNVALCAFLHYPVASWWRAILQIANSVAFCARKGRIRGICRGIFRIPTECYRNRRYRRPIKHDLLLEYLKLRRTASV